MSVTALLFAAALSGQAAQDPPVDCERSWRAECEVVERRRLNRLYGVDPIEYAARSDVVMYRALILSPWATDIVMVSAFSVPGERPRIVAHGRDGARVEGYIASATWRRIVDEAEGIDDVRERPPARPAGPASEVTEIDFVCMDGGLVSIEMANAVDPVGRSRPVRRVRQGECSYDTRAARFGYLLANLAAEALPLCRSVSDYGGAPARLRVCLSLRGDRWTAAELMNSKDDPPDRHGTYWNTDAWAAWLATGEQGRLDWAGAVLQETPGAEASIATALADHVRGLAEVDLYQTEFGARNGREGWISGEIYIAATDEPGPRRVADYRQTWRRRGDGEWSLQSWTVGPFRSAQ